MVAPVHKTLCIRLSCLIRQILTVFIVIGCIFRFSAVTIQAATEFTEEPILRLETGQHTAPVKRISVDAQQRFLVSGSNDKTARVYDIKTGRCYKSCEFPSKVLMTVLFLDTCYSGNLMSGQKGDTQPDTDRLANELAEADTGVIVFASSTGKQISKEDEKWGNGAFTSALIEGIEGQGDYTKDWHVSIAELEVWISDEVKKLTEGSQTPVTAKPKAVEDLKVFYVIQEKKGEGKE
jgi:WD40 repeat protein